MPRKVVISICILNIFLGIGLLWLILNPRKPLAANALQKPEQTSATAYTDEELWSRARGAESARQAYGALRGLSENRETFATMRRELERLTETVAPPPFAAWPYYEALLSVHASRSETAEDLEVAARIASTTALPLNLREAAFRGYIENFVRLGGEGRDAGAAYALVDRLYGETNALSGTALHAGRFLVEKGYDRDEPGILTERAAGTLLDPEAMEGNRLAAAEVLRRLGERPKARALRAAFEATKSERLKIALLQLIAADPSETEREWLEQLRPATPELERLVRTILQSR